jgi:uncharacterized metal-binding protein
METCSCGGKKVLLYTCSGGANVGEIADRAARRLMAEGQGAMFCLAGLGAGIPGMIETARAADVNLVIDGCPVACAKKVFDKAGLNNYTSIAVADLGIEKAKGVPVTADQVTAVVAKARELLTNV